MLLRIGYIIWISFYLNTLNAQSDYIVSKIEMEQDLDYLYEQLGKYHCNLYLYRDSIELVELFDRIKIELPDSLSEQDVFGSIAIITSFIQDGHSYVYPSQNYLDSFHNTALLFPFDVFNEDDSTLVITRNLSEYEALNAGTKILAINDVPVIELHEYMTNNLMKDGDNKAYAEYIYYEFFTAYYAFFYGYYNEYKLHIELENGQDTTYQVKGMVKPDLVDIRSERKLEDKSDKAIYLEIDAANSLGILTIKTFDNSILKDDYNQKFKPVVKQLFKEIEAAELAYLAIDLRGNQGGELRNGTTLLRSIMHQPFRTTHKVSTISPKHDEDGHQKLKSFGAIWENEFKPYKNAFGGEVYMFINGGSYSCSAIVSNAFKTYDRGTVVGTMSGGSAYVNSGGAYKVVTLPHSKAMFSIPRTRYQLRNSLDDLGGGVLPDAVVHDRYLQVLGEGDACLDWVREDIKRKRG